MKILTIDEMEFVEDYAGLPWDAFADPTKPKSKLMKALVCVLKRRDNPDFTIEDAGRMDVSEVEALIEGLQASIEDPKD